MFVPTHRMKFSELFERRKKFGVPVYQSRHPELNGYIGKVLKSVYEALVEKGSQEIRIAVNITNSDDTVVERFVFVWKPFGEQSMPPSLADLQGDLQSLLLKLSTVDAVLQPLPENCLFFVEIEFMDDEDAELEDWVVVPGSSQPIGKSDSSIPSTVPLKKFQCGSTQLLAFVEQCKIGALSSP
uniref:HORMA domain-containing protein n=1 Tax=Palpitomonas bilix TaxID=652834 RepID=A0A7S3G770_9EUKA|mmetsp:Transcript_25193/g.63218  ORF Transcript_25193/g.63218 Transcript_25193/m.63218 type:complete len:184 (+) Transcript_25193:296-847(+)